MNPMTHTSPAGRNSPIAAFEPADPCLPAHVAEAYNTPPKGYLRRKRDAYRRPDGGGMFVTHIPRNTADASTYIANMQFPHTRKSHTINAIRSIQPPSLGTLYGVVIMTICASLLMVSTEVGTTLFTASLAALIVCVAVIIGFSALAACSVALDTRALEHPDTYSPTAPTKLMRTIHNRSINVATTMPGLADKAWKVYLYDVEHYDEYADIIADIVDDPAKYSTKTYAVQQNILDTFWRTSLLRQKAVRRDLDAQRARIKQQRCAEHTQAQHQAAITDEMRANTLTTTVLDKLKADEAAAHVIYSDSDDD